MLVVLGSLWAVATPAFGSPDESSQVIRAWSVEHGQLIGHDTHGAYRRVTAPEVYKTLIPCYAFDPRNTADCFSLGSSSRTAQLLTYSGRYFPAYYLAVGLPTLFKSPGSVQLDMMRFVSVLLAAALLASAFVTAGEARIPTVTGAAMLLAVTPTVLFLAASVNPSGLEITAAIGVWASGALLAQRAAQGAFSDRLVDRLGIAAIVLVIARPLGLLWLAIAGVVLAVVAGRGGVERLWASIRCRRWLAGIVAAAVLVLAWDFWQGLFDSSHYLGTPPPGPLSTWTILSTSIGKLDWLVRQMIAVFGWTDIAAPSVTFAVWFLAVGGIVGMAIVMSSRRWTLALALAVVTTLVLPVLLEAAQVREVGYQWQGRYTLPLVVGIPLLAGFGVSETSTARFSTRRLSVVLVIALTSAQLAAFWQPLRAYSVGYRGPVWFFGQAQWSPPISSLVLIVAYLVATVLLASSALRFWPRDQTHPASPEISDDVPAGAAPGQPTGAGR